jgi:hypothetical protein
MNVILHIPDDVAERLAHGGDLERQALEALATEAFRAGRLSEAEFGSLLGAAAGADPDASLETRPAPGRRMTADQILSFGDAIAAMPLRDARSPREIMDDLSAA